MIPYHFFGDKLGNGKLCKKIYIKCLFDLRNGCHAKKPGCRYACIVYQNIYVIGISDQLFNGSGCGVFIGKIKIYRLNTYVILKRKCFHFLLKFRCLRACTGEYIRMILGKCFYDS